MGILFEYWAHTLFAPLKYVAEVKLCQKGFEGLYPGSCASFNFPPRTLRFRQRLVWKGHRWCRRTRCTRTTAFCTPLQGWSITPWTGLWSLNFPSRLQRDHRRAFQAVRRRLGCSCLRTLKKYHKTFIRPFGTPPLSFLFHLPVKSFK